ncbi:hypothetical protein KPL78_20085 [Roseomonas sp. HJA6]|uniref:Uncharacterized protein n=1 Tax=Roseomonas alba TaxID=2846776 RepID=A0ABS7ADP2_9PROT|nr:hypothetical protein [Neoroseomonas alba]MBW6400170.1 hypothetical protein [Neoroseomonas alba]
MPVSESPAAQEAAPAPSGPGADAIRRTLRGPPGRLALRLAAPAMPARRRVALALLEEAGRPRGGTVLETAEGDLLLTEAASVDGTRVADLLEGLLGAAVERLDLPEGAARLLALPGLAPAAPAQAVAPSATGIEALADAAPLPALLRRDGVLYIARGAPQRLALLRLRLPVAAVAPHLGPAAQDGDVARHARDRLRGRLLAALAEPARRDGLLGAMPPVPLLIDLPLALLPELPAPAAEEEPAPAPALVATLSVGEAMTDGLAERRAALRQAGWGLAVRGLNATRLALLAPEALPADLLLLRWSPALADRAAASALRRVDPARLVLTGCDGSPALEWGFGLGIARFAGPWIDTLMAAKRMAACAHATACTRTACAARARAATTEGRQGCADRALLAGLLPAEAAS